MTTTIITTEGKSNDGSMMRYEEEYAASALSGSLRSHPSRRLSFGSDAPDIPNKRTTAAAKVAAEISVDDDIRHRSKRKTSLSPLRSSGIFKPLNSSFEQLLFELSSHSLFGGLGIDDDSDEEDCSNNENCQRQHSCFRNNNNITRTMSSEKRTLPRMNHSFRENERMMGRRSQRQNRHLVREEEKKKNDDNVAILPPLLIKRVSDTTASTVTTTDDEEENWSHYHDTSSSTTKKGKSSFLTSFFSRIKLKRNDGKNNRRRRTKQLAKTTAALQGVQHTN